MTDQESNLLYEGYREDRYQKIREKYECWYTKKVNDALNSDSLYLREQQRVIEKLLRKNIHSNIEKALDYGGNKGETFSPNMNFGEKYVYDISGVETIDGVEKVNKYEDLAAYKFDFIMCNMTFEHVSYPKDLLKMLYDIGTEKTYYYIEVPSENPFEQNKFSVKKNMALLTNKYYSKIRLVRYYFHMRRQPYMPMSEHINFFTPKAIEKLLDLGGFETIDIQENIENGALGKSKVLSVLAKKKI